MAGLTAGARAAALVEARREELAREVSDALFAGSPEMAARYGDYGRGKCLQDMRHNLEHLQPALELEDPGIFARYAAWLHGLLYARGVPTRDLVACLEATGDALAARLAPDEAEVAARCLRAGRVAVRGEA